MALPEQLSPKEQRILEIIEQEAPEYTSLFGKFLFQEIYGVEWKEAGELSLVADELYVPSSPDDARR